MISQFPSCFKVAQIPEKDELNWSKVQLLAKLDVCMGGRVAEELVFGKENITTGEERFALISRESIFINNCTQIKHQLLECV